MDQKKIEGKNKISFKHLLVSKLPDFKEINKCVIYGWPDECDTGDHFLSLGTLFYLIEHHDSKILHIGTPKRYNFKQVNNADTIILVGGVFSNFLYPSLYKQQLDVLKTFKDKKIIIFPTSICFNNDEDLKELISLFKNTKIVVYIREKESFDILKQHKFIKVHLVPDMSFYLEDHVQYFKYLFQSSYKYLLRNDVEGIQSSDDDSWAAYPSNFLQLLKKYVNPDVVKYPYISMTIMLNGLIHLLNHKNFKTDRLSVHTLSIMLNNPHVFMNNFYHKNESFYKTWTGDIDFVNFEKR